MPLASIGNSRHQLAIGLHAGEYPALDPALAFGA